MNKLIIIRHGESVWNKENIFTGWIDAPLSEEGISQAKKAGQFLKEKGFSFDIAFTSVLKRAYDTLNLILEEMNLNVPIEKSWRLNERHYGGLQGMNKDEAREKFGEERVEIWRRSYDVKPPANEENKEFKYKEIKEGELPLTESLKDTEERLIPYWKETIAPQIMSGKKVIIAAHGNSIRALIKNIEELSGEEITNVEIPIGIPLVYELDDNLKPINKYYLSVQVLD
ncbi:MAG TPA: 2,3-diphosphoglycerate-dependent phosphoglycerate mutase [Candidatus Pacearchaeota archaeon]|nr:2,3-diphosphoglycerate-dependent phosphoglycerate mutase [Candidatus Pacearchaeota archaeon]HPR80073.1 2,3-diphosphoglycerate-dependent phosphoglycerate mutase [Candidatus Pacearchaeota archaeon]